MVGYKCTYARAMKKLGELGEKIGGMKLGVIEVSARSISRDRLRWMGRHTTKNVELYCTQQGGI